MKTFSALAVILVLVLSAAAISSSQDNYLNIDSYTARGNVPAIVPNNDTGGDLIQDSNMIPETPPLVQSEGIEYISSCLWSDLSDAHLENGRIYCAFTYGLAILDATTGPPFETISQLYLPSAYGRGDKLEKYGDYVYFTRNNELLVIDVSDVSHPAVAGSYPSQGEFKRVEYTDGALYLLEKEFGKEYGLTILDVSEPAKPRLLSTTTDLGDDLSYISVSGGIAVTGYRTEVNILDVSDPSAPALLSSPELLNVVNAVVRDGLLFTFTHKYGVPDSLVIYDLSDPADPSMMGVHVTSDPEVLSTAMMFSGSLLFTAGEIIDISDPSAPAAIADYDGYYNPPLGLDENTLYKWGNNRFDTFDITDLESPYSTGTQILPGDILDVHVQGDIAYVGVFWQGLVILDISDIHHPVVLSELESISGFQALDVQGDILFSGRYVVDVSDPANPVILAGFNGKYFDIHFENDIAFALRDDIPVFEGLYAFDLSDPRNPQILSFYNVELPSFGSLAVQDTLAFITPYERNPGIRILSYSDPTAPELIGTYGSESASPWNIVVAVEGNIMYTRILSQGKSELRVVDIHDPRNPVTIGVYGFNMWYPVAMVPKGDILYTTDRYGNTIVFDVSDPANPLYLENFETPSRNTQNLFIEGQRLFLADYYGFMIARTPYGAPPARQVALDIKPGSCPNPLNVTVPNGKKANGGVLPVAILGTGELDVLDIDVSSLELAGAAPLRHGYSDVAGPSGVEGDCACSETGPDGYPDLTLKFRRLDVVAGLDSVSGGNVPVTLTGQMKDGTPIEGADCVRIVPRKSDQGPRLAAPGAAAVTALGPATPNPFNPATTITYELAARGQVTLSVYDVTGKLITTLVDGEMPEGRNEVTWEAEDVSSGMYFYRMQAGDFVQTRKMILLK